jgi:hypothetical protein
MEESLRKVELIFSDVSAALVSGDPIALEASSVALRQAALEISALVQRLMPFERKNKELKLRLKKIATGMAMQRESLIRRTALVETALNAVVPATQNATYAQTTGPYGSAGKQSGAFKYLAA